MRRDPRRVLVVASILVVALFATASAQSGFSMAAFTIGTGGGLSSGGGFSVVAVIAQPIAGEISGGGMTLSGGIVDTVPAGQATATATSRPTATTPAGGSTPTPRPSATTPTGGSTPPPTPTPTPLPFRNWLPSVEGKP